MTLSKTPDIRAGWLHDHPRFGKEITFEKDVAGLEEHRGWRKTPLYAASFADGLEAAAQWHEAEAERIRQHQIDNDQPRLEVAGVADHLRSAAAIRSIDSKNEG